MHLDDLFVLYPQVSISVETTHSADVLPQLFNQQKESVGKE